MTDFYSSLATQVEDLNNKAGSVGRPPRQDLRRAQAESSPGATPFGEGPIDCYGPQYHIAKWKGLEFFVDTSTDEFGRRGDIYEYPLSDYIGYKDLGKKAARFKLEGYLIGADQVDKSRRIRQAIESGEPGPLMHPMFGEMNVACITGTLTADYRKDKKRTKLSFDFCEANASWAPFNIGANIGGMFSSGNESIFAASSGQWSPGSADIGLMNSFYGGASTALSNPTDPASFNAWDALQPQPQFQVGPMTGGWVRAMPMEARALPASIIGLPQMLPGMQYLITLKAAVDPIDYASATIRRIHFDALARLKVFNAFVVNRSEALRMPSPSAQSLIITTRLIVIRDYSIVVAQTNYPTVKEALDDLDFVMAVYDDEELVASRRCDDVLVSAIRKARAAAASVILQRNIRLPGIADFPTDGEWPSLVIAQKLYNDGRRYEDIERYNPEQTPLWMGRRVVAPTR